ncbi:major facilitator superfamily domain-containing protein [Trichoderma breve]|uniref:Major facilitator superfamily domain-containing protein n=1 Tax=Trichoderma breve TaxID=2034170 RepID=A0A9W9EB72_9HYPO|nr:major facilitator superfamily domain-containing protein [Trichoderma breve]KAJ4863499.1 major facilitator superfamily domain-containing protein [Trichoderma breve]
MDTEKRAPSSLFISSPNSATDEESQMEVQEQKKSFKFKVTVFMLCLTSVSVAMDSVIVAATLAAITSSLKGNSLEAFWVGTSYLLAQTVAVPIYGSISDILYLSGRKWVMVFAIAIFLLGSILCGCAQNMNWLVAARVVQGLGGGGCLTLTTVILSDITTLRERPKYLSMGAFAWALGTNIGVPVGGAIGQYTSWRWVFWINIPICIPSIAGIVYALHLVRDKSSFKSKAARVDYLGITVFIAATTLLLYGITTGGTTNPWNSASVLAPLVLGVFGLGVFLLIEWKVTKTPMVPLRIFNNRSGNTGFFGSFVHGLVLWASAYYIIIFFLGARGDPLFKSSAETLPGSAPIALSAVFCGIWVSRSLRFQKMTWLAWALLTTGTGLVALMKPNSSAGILYAIRIIPAIGGGFLFQLPLFAVQSTAAGQDIGIATSMIAFFRSVGQAFGVAIGGTVFQNEFDRFLATAMAAGRIPSDFVITGAQAAGAYERINALPPTMHDVQETYRYIYADALRTVWYVTTGIAGMGFLVGLLVRNENMDRGNYSKQTFQVEESRESSS